ncbi:uncharacterized protein LOC134824583 [Bolinopsis microptera]|uniref:uncharacterized protein LOC134824583 n=1 Tax=Bolinopsis microptera TaxID=2820187 RepID=UPI0030795FD8
MASLSLLLVATFAFNMVVSDIVLVSSDVTGPEPCARICYGESGGKWRKNGNYLSIDSSLSACKFARKALVQTTLVNTGDYSQYSGYVGIEQPTFFRYEMYAPGVSAAKANADGYQINWSAAGYTC